MHQLNSSHLKQIHRGVFSTTDEDEDQQIKFSISLQKTIPRRWSSQALPILPFPTPTTGFGFERIMADDRIPVYPFHRQIYSSCSIRKIQSGQLVRTELLIICQLLIHCYAQEKAKQASKTGSTLAPPRNQTLDQNVEQFMTQSFIKNQNQISQCYGLVFSRKLKFQLPCVNVTSFGNTGSPPPIQEGFCPRNPQVVLTLVYKLYFLSLFCYFFL